MYPEKKTWYKVYKIYRGIKELIGSYQEAEDAHAAAQRYNTPHTYITIEKTSKPHSEVGNY
jgi:hypothetical protein